MTDKQYPELPEPDSYVFQHEETGQSQFIDRQQVEWGFEKNNPRLHRVGEAFTVEQMRAYVDADRATRALQAAPVAQGDALDQGVREELSIGKAINRAARDLPEGWEIRIDLERHAGVVFLIDPDGNETMSEGGELFSDQINAAIDAARTQQEDKSGANHDL